jgi:hypothetical protein
MIVNTFIQDCQDVNPLVRALAVRHMCRVRLESVAEHMISPLGRCMGDSDPYVRKTAAFGVAKLYDIIPEIVESSQLFKELIELLNDENPMVVSNTAAAIFEINERRTESIFKLDSTTITPFVSAVASCTDWCQVVLLDTLGRYTPEGAEDASFLIDRLIPLLKNSNPAVVIGAFRCIFLYMGLAQRSPTDLFPQIIPPFVTLVSGSEPEIQYVVLRTLSLFVQRYPKSLAKEIRVFFCKYNDPAYVKMEKLDIIVAVCHSSNGVLVLNELSEYCNDVDVAFVQKSIRCIGRIAIRMEIAATKCMDILCGLVAGKADYAIEESIIVICDLLRKYPGKFESVLTSACRNLEKIKEPRAKAAGIWILGEYCHIIEGVDVLLDQFLDSFHDEPSLVQLQILSSLVKLYLDKPDATRDQLQFVLTEATKNQNVPDVKNRALMYWRLLSADVAAAKQIVCFGKATLMDQGQRMDENVLAELVRNMGSVAGVLHMVPSDFVKRVRYIPEADDVNESGVIHDWETVQLNDSSTLDVFVDFGREHMYLKIINKSLGSVRDFAFALNKNAIGLTVKELPSFPESLEFGDVMEVTVPIAYDMDNGGNMEELNLQMALRSNSATVYGICRIPIELVLTKEGKISQEEYRDMFGVFSDCGKTTVQDAEVADEQQLADRNVYVVGRNGNCAYVSLAIKTVRYLASLAQEGNDFEVQLKGSDSRYAKLLLRSAVFVFAQK